MIEILDEDKIIEQITIRNKPFRILERLVLLSCFYNFLAWCFLSGSTPEESLLLLRSFLPLIYIIWFQVESKAVEGWPIRNFFPLSMNLLSALVLLMEGGICFLLSWKLYNNYIGVDFLQNIYLRLIMLFTGVLNILYILMTRHRVNLCKRIQNSKK